MTQLDLRSDHRHIIKRIIIRGNLVLETPTCLGSGDRDSLTDLALLRDSISDRALLTGASLAGALRNYLRERVQIFGQDNESPTVTLLFGGTRGDEDGGQSSLIINDSISREVPSVEFRDGVRINSVTGTAADQAKYDLELLPTGTIFPLLLELPIEKNQDEMELKQALAIALQGLEAGEIAIGMKKRRGFGCCKVSSWQVYEFNLQDVTQLRAWLHYDHWNSELQPRTSDCSSIAAALNVPTDQLLDRRIRFKLSAKFCLQGAVLIRSGQDITGLSPDVVQLTSRRGDQTVPVISGTSWAGVLRHRAERILNTLKPQSADAIIKPIFGDDKAGSQADPHASRLIVHESIIEQTTDLVQTRIAIDRFTGGALHGALLQEQPIFGGEVTLNLELRNPEPYEIGLLLLLLKDLWTGDLPVGGSSSIGRGRLQGKTATLSDQKQTWTIEQLEEKKLIVSDAEGLERFAKELIKQLKLEVAA